MSGPTFGGSPVRSLSLDQIEEELARTERTLVAYRSDLKRSYAQSAADDASLREMGNRVKDLLSRSKTWKGTPKRADAAELEGLRAEIKTRSASMDRTIESMKTKSAEARELDKRQQALSTRRAELLNQGG